jgi:hypothetical protein
VQLVAIDLGRIEGELDAVEGIDGVACRAGQIGGGTVPIAALAVQQYERAQSREVGGIGRHGCFQRLLGRRLVAEIVLVPNRHGDQ